MKPKIFSTCFFLLLLVFQSGIFIQEAYSQDTTSSNSIQMAGLQMTATNDIEANKKNILEGIEKASSIGAKFLVTPEGSLSGYTSNFKQAEVLIALDEIRSKAVKLHVGLMLGTCFKEQKKGNELCYNQVRVYNPDGEYQGSYSKILRCSPLDLPGTGEMTDYVEGELKIFEWNGTRFGILICNDLWATPGYTTMPNPYLAWKLKQMGAQFIVHCINSGSNQKYRPFHESSAELWAYSLQIPIMEVNAAQQNTSINAQSGLIDAQGERSLRVPDSGLQFFTVEIHPGSGKESTVK